VGCHPILEAVAVPWLSAMGGGQKPIVKPRIRRDIACSGPCRPRPCPPYLSPAPCRSPTVICSEPESSIPLPPPYRTHSRLQYRPSPSAGCSIINHHSSPYHHASSMTLRCDVPPHSCSQLALKWTVLFWTLRRSGPLLRPIHACTAVPVDQYSTASIVIGHGIQKYCNHLEIVPFLQ
jgi:hypothetical protein